MEDKKYYCSDCGIELDKGEGSVFTVCEVCWDKHYKKDNSIPVELPVLLPKRNSFGQWISVKDKLPELDETVLCYSKVKDIDGNTYNVTSLGSRFINYTQKPVFLAESGRFAETIEIIKWMPLPKP